MNEIKPEMASPSASGNSMNDFSLVEVRSVVPLSASQQELLAARLASSYGIKAQFKFVLDESLLGGLVVQAGDIQIDNSYKTKLKTLRHLMRSLL